MLSPAKINLGLAVGAPRADGFHPLDSVVLALDFGDEIHIEPAPQTSLSRRWTQDAPRQSTINWAEQDDLAMRALRLLEQHCNTTLNYAITIDKRIPTGAGLGGGSSNAAAVLISLNQQANLNLDTHTLCQLGAQLGSDIPVMIYACLGTSHLRMTGRGEQVTPIQLGEWHGVLIFPAQPCPTGHVYQQFDTTNNFDPLPDGHSSRIDALIQGQQAPFNDLEQAAANLNPEISALLRFLKALPETEGLTLSGSGSTLFVSTPDAGSAREIAGDITRCHGLPARAVCSCNSPQHNV